MQPLSRKGFQLQVKQDGRTILLQAEAASGARIVPLGYKDLVRYANERADVPVTLQNMAISSDDDANAEIQKGTASFEWNLRHNAGIFILIENGWTIPGPWVDADYLLLDRNVVIDLEKLGQRVGGSFSEPEGFWADLLGMCNSECHLLNFAVEGGSATKPGLREFLDETRRAYQAACKLFSKEQVITIDDARLTGSLGLIGDFERFFRKASSFLGKVLPMLAHQISANERYAVFQRLLRAAKDSGLKAADVLVILAISCLYAAAGGNHLKKPINPGRAILKPSLNPTPKDMYNAAFDAWLVELVMGGNALSDKRVALATKDKGLAALWSLFEPREFRLVEGVPTGTVSVSQDMFPAMPRALFSKLVTEVLS
jgi:hypothetical protein